MTNVLSNEKKENENFKSYGAVPRKALTMQITPVVQVVSKCCSDAIVVLEDQLVNGGAGDSSTLSLESEDTISLKVQSSKKTATFFIAKVCCCYTLLAILVVSRAPPLPSPNFIPRPYI